MSVATTDHMTTMLDVKVRRIDHNFGLYTIHVCIHHVASVLLCNIYDSNLKLTVTTCNFKHVNALAMYHRHVEWPGDVNIMEPVDIE